MIELCLRLISAVAILVASGLTQRPSFEVGWKISLALATYATIAYLFERRGLRNSGVSGFVAVADAAVIAYALAAAGELKAFGFLVLAPGVYAAARYGSNTASMAPLAAAFLLMADVQFGPSSVPSNSVMVQAACILVIGLLANQARTIVKAAQPTLTAVQEPVPGPEPAQYLLLRENLRSLKEQYEALENSSRAEHTKVRIQEAIRAAPRNPFHGVAKVLREITGASGITLYAHMSFSENMVVQSAVGKLPERLKTASIDVSGGWSEAQLKHRVQITLNALKSDQDKAYSANILLRTKGKLVGMVALFVQTPGALDRVQSIAQELSSLTAELLQEAMDSEQNRRRLRETELLYHLASLTVGAETPTHLAARVVREVFDTLKLDHLSVSILDGVDALVASSAGAKHNLLDIISFPNGEGVEGWLKSGAPETIFLDTGLEPAIPKGEAFKKRVGSFALIPVQFSENPYGFLIASTHSSGGLGQADVETLRTITAELSQAIARLESSSSGPYGWATPREFQQTITFANDGYLIHLETIRCDELMATHGKPALDHALNQLANRLRPKLTQNGILCRRFEGDLMIYLPQISLEFARSWANEATTLASMTALRTPDGRARIPLAMRAKVAQIGQQNYENSEESVA